MPKRPAHRPRNWIADQTVYAAHQALAAAYPEKTSYQVAKLVGEELFVPATNNQHRKGIKIEFRLAGEVEARRTQAMLATAEATARVSIEAGGGQIIAVHPCEPPPNLTPQEKPGTSAGAIAKRAQRLSQGH
jgi:hypothetical protein